MEKIIDPVAKELIVKELKDEFLLRHTNKADNLLYIITAQQAPNTMREIGRLREEAFRLAGGGSGMEVDIDEADTMENGYKQLIVWNPEKQEIMGGYRFILGKDVLFDQQGQPILSSAHYFHFSELFIKKYLPQTIELGRSFVTVGYQSSVAGAKALFILDNLWDGLGALSINYPGTKYFFGKVTMYKDLGEDSRNLILYFLHRQFPDPERLVYPKTSFDTNMDCGKMNLIFDGGSFRDNYKILNKRVQELSSRIPPLVSSYIKLSPSIRILGTIINSEFNDVEETGILVDIDEIFEEKRERHIMSYLNELTTRKYIEELDARNRRRRKRAANKEKKQTGKKP